MSAEPAAPSSEPDGKRLFVNLMRAVMPSGAGAASASWIASPSGFGSGVGPLPPAATAMAALPAATAAMAAMSRSKRVVDRVRSSLKAFLSRGRPPL
jgi:hypothetical protein